MSQELIQEAMYDQFKINELYKESVARPNDNEYRALLENILQYGQLEPIKVNKDMVILDGYTRYDILSERGRKVKFIVIEPEDEYRYVVEINVMRRNFNAFQRVETMYQLYTKIRMDRREKDMTSFYDVMYAIKEGYKSTKDIVEATGLSRRHIQRVTQELVEDYSVRKEEVEEPKIKTSRRKETGGRKHFEFTLLPRGVSRLEKAKPRPQKGEGVLIGKTVGVNRNTVTQAVTVIEKGTPDMKKQCRAGTLGIFNAYNMILGRIPQRSFKQSPKLQCPHCMHEDERRKFKRIV